jgi:hypothetical protein
MKIWKYLLPITDEQTIDMPEYSTVLSVQATEHNLVYMWVMVCPENNLVKHRFKIFGTGHELSPDTGYYLGTVQTHHGALVWHVFDAGEDHNEISLPTSQTGENGISQEP